MPDALSDKQIIAILSQQIGLAKYDRKNGGREASQQKAIDYFFGNMDSYVPPEANRSKVVSRDVADTIGWIMPQTMKVFTASGQMFVAEPDEPEDETYAREVTTGLNYIFWKKNDGYATVYNATWDALMHGDGIVKTFYEETPVYSAPRFYENLTEDERAFIAGGDDVDVLAQTENAVQGIDLSGAPITETRYDLKVRTKRANGRYVVTVIPPEDFLSSNDAASLEEAAFKDHWSKTKTRSDLIAMGYEKDLVWTIPTAAKNETEAAQARNSLITSDATDKSMEQVDYHECFVMVDVDGDGVAEMIRACAGGPIGEVLLDWEVWEDEDPFDNIPCEPIPHRWDSRSVADETIDIQDIKTVLWRQLLNNTYWTNNPQRFVKGNIKNPEELNAPTFGGTVFGDQNASVEDLNIQYIGDKALAAMQHADEVRASRTGVNAQTMAIDPEVLQNQSATANQNATDASRSQPEMIARNMAEFGWAKVGRKLMRLMNRHEDGPRTVLVKGQPVRIDARTWNPEMHITVNTGLGTGSRDRDLLHLQMVLQNQLALADRLVASGDLDDAVELLPKVIETMTKMAECAGLRNPDAFYPEFTEQKVAQLKELAQQRASQPNPQLEIAQVKAQAEMGKAQSDAQLRLVEANATERQSQLEAQLAQANLQIQQLKIAQDSQDKRFAQILQSFTTLRAAEISAKAQTDQSVLDAQMESELGFQSHMQDVHLAEVNAALQPQPTQPNQG